jgi:choline dehydrogenase-like flavoprotein
MMTERLGMFDADLEKSGSVNSRARQGVWDAIIVGAGAAGAVFARELTRAGLHVLMLERGKYYQDHRREFAENELAMWERVWSNDDYGVSGDGFTGAPNFGHGVGGGTLVWTAVSLRMLEHDFRLCSTYGQPAGSSVTDWPFQLSELQPYYLKAEQQMGVAGATLPWEDPQRPARPFPAFPYYRSSERLVQGMRRLGLRPAPGPVAIASRTRQSRNACLHCGFCRSGCRIDAKYQCDHTLVAEALATGLLDLRINAAVLSIDQAGNPQRASGVTYADMTTGERHRVRSRLLFVCNNPIEMPRLFLNSANRSHPRGLANSNDQVGRHFHAHMGTVGAGVTNECLNSSVGYNMGNVITLDRARSQAPQSYIGGFSIESLNGAGAGVLAVDPYNALFGPDLKQKMRRYNNTLFAIAFCEGLPVADNRIMVDADRRDASGMPKAHIHYKLHENDKTLFDEANRTLAELMRASGAQEVHLTPRPFEAHPGGSMRMGDNSRASVANEFGKVHELENVYLGGAALFVSSGCVNPTLTLHALALRTCDHVRRRFGLH